MNEMLQNLKCNTTILQISIQCRIDNGMILTGEEVSANKTHRLKKKKKKKKKNTRNNMPDRRLSCNNSLQLLAALTSFGSFFYE